MPDKRHAVVLCFLRAALAETADAVVEMQDKLITGVTLPYQLRTLWHSQFLRNERISGGTGVFRLPD